MIKTEKEDLSKRIYTDLTMASHTEELISFSNLVTLFNSLMLTSI